MLCIAIFFYVVEVFRETEKIEKSAYIDIIVKNTKKNTDPTALHDRGGRGFDPRGGSKIKITRKTDLVQIKMAYAYHLLTSSCSQSNCVGVFCGTF